jgi:hypothetical protein
MPMVKMYCHCGHSVWMHFLLKHGSFRACYTSSQNHAQVITDCPGCGALLNLMVTHIEFK